MLDNRQINYYQLLENNDIKLWWSTREKKLEKGTTIYLMGKSLRGQNIHHKSYISLERDNRTKNSNACEDPVNLRLRLCQLILPRSVLRRILARAVLRLVHEGLLSGHETGLDLITFS